MSAEEILKSIERSALNNNQIISHVVGKKTKFKSSKKLRSFGAAGFITLALVIVAVFLAPEI